MNIHKLPVFAESWSVAFRKKQNASPIIENDTPYKVVNNSFRYWAADPFLFENGDDIYIFAELYDYVHCRGIIGYYQLNAAKPRWKPVIQEKHHLSFPFIYELNNEIYILPEAHVSGTLYRYRAIHFPDQWEREEPLLENVRFVDSTPISQYGYDLALTYDLDDAALKMSDFAAKTTKLLYRDKEGLRRPAGYISAETGIRAAQECVEDYGKGIVFYKFEISENKGYAETEVARMYPEGVRLSKKLYLDGMHTYNQSQHYEVIDVKTRRFNILNLCMRLYRKLKS